MNLPKLPVSGLKKMPTLEDIRAKVEENGNVATTTMEKLRDAVGAKKLGIYVLDDITKKLRGQGLGHYPTELPNNQSEPVRVYKIGTTVGDLIEAVIAPGENNDEKIKEAAEGEASGTLAEIRRLVCA